MVGGGSRARCVGELGAVLVPVGGGGLISGIASVLKAVDPSIKVRAAGWVVRACTVAAMHGASNARR